MKLIVVQMSDAHWTMEAMHLASALARRVDGKVVLLHLALANNPGLLGWGIAAPTEDEQRRFDEYAAIAEDYGVEFCVQPMQYTSRTDALIQATQQLNAFVLFAQPAKSYFRVWGRFQRWNLKRQLGCCRLHTLSEEEPLSIEAPAFVAG